MAGRDAMISFMTPPYRLRSKIQRKLSRLIEGVKVERQGEVEGRQA